MFLFINFVLLFLFLGCLFLGVPIFYSLSFFSILGIWNFFFWQGIGFLAAISTSLSVINSTVYDFLNNYHLLLIPLFVAMGNLAGKSGIIQNFYDFLCHFLKKIPGGLAIATLLGCGGFSAISGSSVVCAATLSRVTIPSMLRYGYPPAFSAASVAAGGTLGSLLPPSILFILYSFFSQQSVKKLFLLALFPSLLTILAYMLVIFCKFQYGLTNKEKQKIKDAEIKFQASWIKLLPIGILFLIIMGIYFGILTPTESAAMSFLFALLISLKVMHWREVLQSLKDSLAQTTIIFAIAIGAKLLILLFTLTGLVENLQFWVMASQPAFWLILLVIVLIYLFLGMFLDSIGILVFTLPFLIPIAEFLGWNLLWLGVLVVKLLEIGLLTPPVGLNVFVVQIAFPKIAIDDIFRALVPFLLLDLIIVFIIIQFLY